MKKIYLDYAATTYVEEDVLKVMMPYFSDIYGNAASAHSFGRNAIMAVDEARENIAKMLNAKSGEIYFTSGGTESDNWAIKGIAAAHKKKGNHIITSKIEHHAVLNTCEYLEKQGYRVTYLSVDSNGIVDLDELLNSICEQTILVTIMTANNEIGTIQPIEEIGRICKDRSVLFHTDAVQAIGAMHIDVKAMNIDLLSLSAHKFYGPKGVGVLYIRNGVRIDKLMSGGAQERARRAGTTNTPSIVGMSYAMKKAIDNMEENNNRYAKMRDYFINRVIEEIPHIRVNGCLKNRLSNNINISCEYIEGEGLLLLLDFDGIAVSSGSACASSSLDASHVLLAIGVPIEVAHGSLRLTLGHKTTMEDMEYTVEKLKAAVEKLRAMSPLFLEIKGENTYV